MPPDRDLEDIAGPDLVVAPLGLDQPDQATNDEDENRQATGDTAPAETLGFRLIKYSPAHLWRH